jgi:hypothetical protein
LEPIIVLRRQTLYPAELRAHCNGYANFRAFLDHSKKNPIINAALLLGTFPRACVARWPLLAHMSLAFHPHIVLKLFLVNLDAFMVLLLRFCFSK